MASSYSSPRITDFTKEDYFNPNHYDTRTADLNLHYRKLLENQQMQFQKSLDSEKINHVRSHEEFNAYRSKMELILNRQEYRGKYEQEVAINRSLSEETRLLRGNNEEIRMLYNEAREKYRNLHFLFEQKINECEALTIKLHDMDLVVDRNKELYDQFNRALRENDTLSSKLRSDETMATEELISLRAAINERERRIMELSRHLEEANLALENENRQLRETGFELNELRRKHKRDLEDSDTMIKRLMADLDESQRRGVREIIKEVPKVEIIREPAKVEYVRPDPVQSVVYKEDPEMEAKVRRLERENRDLKAELDKFRNICEDKEDEIERLRVPFKEGSITGSREIWKEGLGK